MEKEVDALTVVKAAKKEDIKMVADTVVVKVSTGENDAITVIRWAIWHKRVVHPEEGSSTLLGTTQMKHLSPV